MAEELTDEESTPLTELEILEANLLSFKIAPKEYKDQRAYELIKEYFMLGQVIPDDLGSFLDKACDYQLSNLGNRVTNQITDDQWRSRVIDVEMLRRRGYTVNKAIKAIVDRDGGAYAESSLKAKRREYKEEREPEFVDKIIYETIKVYGLAENDLAKIILTIS